MHDDPSVLDHELDAFGHHIRAAAERRRPQPGDVRARARSVRARRRAAGSGTAVVVATVLGSAAVWQRQGPAPAPLGSLALTGSGTAPGSTITTSSATPASPVPTAPTTSPTTGPEPTVPPTTATRPPTSAPTTTEPPSSPSPASEFAWPVDGRRGDGFGFGAGRNHEGLDILAPTGTPVRAARDGRIAAAGWNGSYGNLVVIEHADGFTTRYAHLSVVGVAVGDVVTTGQVVGEVGMTGSTTGPQLHFEIRRGDVAEDPLAHLP